MAVHDVRTSIAFPESELLLALVNNTSTMIAYWDADQRCRFTNRAYETWFGVSADMMRGTHIRELLGSCYEVNRPCIEAVLRGELQEFQRDFPDPSGGPALHGLVRYLPDVVDGVSRGFFTVVVDVSPIKRAEAALRESEERFRLAIDEAPIGMVLCEPTGRFLRVNHAFCELVGYSAEELAGMTFVEITHPDDVDTDVALMHRLARGDVPRIQFGKRYVRKDGAIVDANLNASVLRDSSGAALHFIAQIEDITERRRAESEQRLLAAIGLVFADSLDFEDTLTRITELVVAELADFCVIDVFETDAEPRTLKAAGRDPELVATCHRLAQYPLDRSRPHLMRSVVETRQPLLLQLPSPAALASFAQYDDHLQLMRDAHIQSMILVPLLVHERLIGGLALISSRPGHVYASADLRFAEELARRAALSVENARLYRAERRATRARDDVLGIVAHDLRNPLNSIMLQTTVLQTAVSDDRAARAIHGIERSVGRMQRLIQDLLDVAQMEAGTLSVEAGPVAIHQVLDDSIEAHRALASAAALELVLDVPADPIEVRCDRDRLNQIFENLIGNAIKFSPRGGVVTVSATPQPDEVVFRVSDTGHGVPADALPHLFDRFWQAETPAKRQGAGLGLPIVKGLVEAHGGRIWVESTQGTGTTVYFTMPLAASASPPAVEAATG